MTVGEFFSEHRKLIDSRKAHLTRIGIVPPDVAPPRDAMPSQAEALAMPTTSERPLLDATHAPPQAPKVVPNDYTTPKLPKLPGVNIQVHEE